MVAPAAALESAQLAWPDFAVDDTALLRDLPPWARREVEAARERHAMERDGTRIELAAEAHGICLAACAPPDEARCRSACGAPPPLAALTSARSASAAARERVARAALIPERRPVASLLRAHLLELDADADHGAPFRASGGWLTLGTRQVLRVGVGASTEQALALADAWHAAASDPSAPAPLAARALLRARALALGLERARPGIVERCFTRRPALEALLPDAFDWLATLERATRTEPPWASLAATAAAHVGHADHGPSALVLELVARFRTGRFVACRDGPQVAFVPGDEAAPAASACAFLVPCWEAVAARSGQGLRSVGIEVHHDGAGSARVVVPELAGVEPRALRCLEAYAGVLPRTPEPWRGVVLVDPGP